MKRISIGIGMILFSFITLAQDKFDVVLSGQIYNSKENTLSLFQQNDLKRNVLVTEIPMDEEGNFEMKVSLKDKDYYTLALDNGQAINLVLTNSDTDTVFVYGNGKSLFFNSNVVNSEASTSLLDFLRLRQSYQQQLDSVKQHLAANPSQKQEIQQGFNQTHQIFIGARQNFIANNGNSPALLGALSTVDVEQEFSLYEQLVKQLDLSFGESPTVKRIMKEYDSNKKIIESRMPLAPGAEAKEISLPNPEGKILNLSDYRGKVVLIDFWAAWCGPCRRENPNVVRLYKEYKDKGFEVFSVSLDKTKESWVNAIKQDGLEWEGHVSDLKFWQSAPAKDYRVSSIPFTVLIDQEGKIIGTNLRGERLASTLASIFGE